MTSTNLIHNIESLKEKIIKTKNNIVQGKIEPDSSEVTQAIQNCIRLYRFFETKGTLDEMVFILEIANEIEEHRVHKVHTLTKQPLTYQWIIRLFKEHQDLIGSVTDWFIPVKTNGLTLTYIRHCINQIKPFKHKTDFTEHYEEHEVVEKLDDQFYASISEDRILKAKETILDLMKSKENNIIQRNDYFTSLEDSDSIQNAIAISYLLTEEKIQMLESGSFQLQFPLEDN